MKLGLKPQIPSTPPPPPPVTIVTKHEESQICYRHKTEPINNQNFEICIPKHKQCLCKYELSLLRSHASAC